MGSSSAQLAMAAARDDARDEAVLAPVFPDAADLPRRLCRIGSLAALAGAVIQTVVYVADALLFEHEPHLLDADGDFSVWAWGSASMLFVGALASGLLALTVRRSRAIRCAALALILAFLSLDETVGIHERLTNDLPSLLGLPDYFSRLIWPAVYLPLLAALALLLLGVSRRLAARPARLVRAGLVLLALAVAAELASTALVADGRTGGSAAYVLQVAFEEGCELGGWTLIAAALVAGVTSQLLAVGRQHSLHLQREPA